MEDNKLAADEARRSTQHESVKAQVEGEVNAEIADRASEKPPPGEAQRIEQVAGQFRAKAVDEVVGTEREVERARGLARCEFSHIARPRYKDRRLPIANLIFIIGLHL